MINLDSIKLISFLRVGGPLRYHANNLPHSERIHSYLIRNYGTNYKYTNVYINGNYSHRIYNNG